MLSRGSDFPLAHTEAVEILAAGLKRASDRDGVSMRQLAKQLGHKQSAMLSHWAKGRVPIPVERVPELASALKLNERQFLLAVLKQRHPAICWAAFVESQSPGYQFVQSLEAIAGISIEAFDPSQIRVMREVAADPRASRRWLSVHEIALVEMVRQLRPGLVEAGLDHHDQHRIRAILSDRR